MKKNPLSVVAFTLIVIGGLNWGLVGAFKFDLVNYLLVELAGAPVLATIVYILVGVSALYMGIASCSGCCSSK